MAGVKGRSGGPRANSGGARPGAGRKKQEQSPSVPIEQDGGAVEEGQTFDPRPTLELVARGLLEVSPQQYKALTALLPYAHTKKGEGGKKDLKAEAAKKVGAGKFAASAPPKLRANVH